MEKVEKLQAVLAEFTGGVLVAFSGGVDSTYLLKAALDVLGPGKVLAVTAVSEVHPRREVEEACSLAASLGARAVAELGIRSPLQEAGMGKEDVRRASRTLGLPTWSKAALACLATRFPYGEEITAAKLSQVEQVEDYLFQAGFAQIRVRHHGSVARLEVFPEDMHKALDLAPEIYTACRQAGFHFAALDLRGYRQGSMHEAEDFKS